MTTENWKDIPGYEGRYQVSDLGNVRSVDRYVRLVTRHGKETQRLARGRLLKPGTCDRFGHCSVAIGKGNSQMVHGLVALAFLGPRPLKHDVAHLNGDGSDNRASNLAYVTRSVNNQHRCGHGRTRLSETQVREIRRRVGAGAKHGAKSELAKEFGVSPSSISDVLAGRSYAHV